MRRAYLLGLLVALWGAVGCDLSSGPSDDGGGEEPPPPPGAGWVKHTGNPVLELGAAGAWDSDEVDHPSVLKTGAVSYSLWYEGTGPIPGQAGSRRGQIGLATSSDGTVWTRFGNAPVLAPGPAGSWDDAEVGSPCVLDDGGTLRMWYTGRGSGGTAIGMATFNGTTQTWIKAGGPVLSPGPGGPQSWDIVGVSTPHVIREGNLYRMWYSGQLPVLAPFDVIRIGYAESSDGVTWVKWANNPLLLDVGATTVTSPAVLRRVGTLHLWFDATQVVNPLGIHHATSADGTAWSLDPENPVLRGVPQAWDSAGVRSPFVIEDGTTLKMWFAGRDASGKTRIGYATR